MRKLYFIFLYIIYTAAHAQPIVPLSGFQNVLALYNPAAAGIEKTELALSHKTQWIGFPEAPKFYALTVNTPFNYERLGAGLNIYNESAGIQNFLYVNGLFSYKINFAKGRLSFGAKIGLVQWNENLNKLIIKDEGDNLSGNKKTSPDLGVGLLYKDKKYSVGISLNYSAGIYSGNVYSNKFYYNLTGIINQKINDRFIIHPALLIRYTDKFSPLISLSAPVEYNKSIWFGVSYRTTSVASAMAGININQLLHDNYNGISIFYYFDYNAGKTVSGNSHELSLLLALGKNRNLETIKRKRATVSPLYFD